MIYLLLAAILEAILNYRVMQGCQGGKHWIFTNYYGQNLSFYIYRDMAEYYYDFLLPVKQTPHQMVTLGCQILICSCSYLIVKLKLCCFIALSAKICYLYKHRSNQIRDYMHRIKLTLIEDHFSCQQPYWITSWIFHFLRKFQDDNYWIWKLWINMN